MCRAGYKPGVRLKAYLMRSRASPVVRAGLQRGAALFGVEAASTQKAQLPGLFPDLLQWVREVEQGAEALGRDTVLHRLSTSR